MVRFCRLESDFFHVQKVLDELVFVWYSTLERMTGLWRHSSYYF